MSQLLLCGDMPEIRSLTAPLIERLNIEVETLDSLDGIDTEQLPEPADQFVEQAASMRMASAIAAEPPPVNLLPVEVTATRAARAAQMVFALGTAAAVAFGAFLYQGAVTRTERIEQQVAALRGQIAAIQPRVRAVEPSRAGSVVETAQQSALDAFDTQGPRVGRVLETLSNANPRSVHITSDGSQWRVSVRAANRSGVETTAECSIPQMRILRLPLVLAMVAPLVIFGFIYVLAVKPNRAAEQAARARAASLARRVLRARVVAGLAPAVAALAQREFEELAPAAVQRTGRQGL